jgi:hypothetical protein
VPNPPRSATERFAGVLFWLGKAVITRDLCGLLVKPLAVLILNRIREIKQRFARLAARIQAGRYAPRRSTPRQHVEQKPRRKSPLPHDPAWLIKLVPEAAATASQLRFLFADPEMAALLAAAPTSLARPIRSLCRMLGVEVPPILKPPPAARPKTPAPKPERPPARTRSAAPERVRYVFGLRYPPPFKNPA